VRQRPRRGASVDIAAWLHGLGLQRYEPVFCDNDIDGVVLPSLTAEDSILPRSATAAGCLRRSPPYMKAANRLWSCWSRSSTHCGRRAATADGHVLRFRRLDGKALVPRLQRSGHRGECRSGRGSGSGSGGAASLLRGVRIPSLRQRVMSDIPTDLAGLGARPTASRNVGPHALVRDLLPLTCLIA